MKICPPTVGPNVWGWVDPLGLECMDPTQVGFSQNSVSYNKVDRATGKPYTFDDLVSSMKKDGWKGDPVDVVKMPDGVHTSMDNTRALAARKAGINVKAHVRFADEMLNPAEIRRFTVKGHNTPKTWGDAINIRIQKQTGGFGERFPNGSLYDP